ncbi:MAG: V-type ATP synthase subunit E family protein [Caldilineaceae bacterium]
MAEILGDPEELMAIIRRTAQQEAINLEAEAQRQSQRQHAEAEAEGQQIRADIFAAARTQAEATRQRRLAQAALEQQHALLRTRQALLDQVWAAAETQLRALVNQVDYVTVLQHLALDAAQILQPGAITLASDPQGHALLMPERLAAWAVDGQVTFVRAPTPAPTWGGLVARHADGRRQVDATFATRLKLARRDLREQVARRLEIL